MAMVRVDNSSLQPQQVSYNLQLKSVGLVWGSTATWRCSTSSDEPGQLVHECPDDSTI